MYYLVEIACVIAEIWLIHLYLVSSLDSRRSPAWLSALLYLFFGAIITLLSLIEGIAFLRLAFTWLGVSAVSFLLFKTSILRSIISGLAICALVTISDLLCTLVLTYLGFDSRLLVTDELARSLYLIFGHVLLLGLVLCVCLINRKNDNPIQIHTMLPLAPCWIVTILLCLILTWQIFVESKRLSPVYLVVLMGLLYTNILVVYFINKITAQDREKRELELAEHHYAIQQEYYDQLRIQQEETKALWHDISKLLRAAQFDPTGAAINQLQKMLDDIVCVVDVNNRIVSVILNEYVQNARNQEVDLCFDVQVPEELFVTASDLYILLGNTIDNALEACSSLPKEHRKIMLKLRVHNNILFYEIENSFGKNHHNRVRNDYHGYGLKNVQKCVERYRGEMNIYAENGVFRVTAHLNSLM